MRAKIGDFTAKRLFQAVERRLKSLPHRFAWNKEIVAKNTLRSYHNKHNGKRCFLIANGPSLKETDLTLLKDEITIGMNRIYLLFDENFVTTYCTVINELVIDEFHKDISNLKCETFVSWTKREFFDNVKQGFFYLYHSIEDGFSTDITKGVYSGGTVTYASLQLAYYMGFSEVILVGLDHNFEDKGTPNKTEVRVGEDRNHFHPDYFPKGMKWQLPDLYRSEVAYAKARTAFELDGRRILDATIGGKCDVFEKVEFQSLFA